MTDMKKLLHSGKQNKITLLLKRELEGNMVEQGMTSHYFPTIKD